MRPVTLAVLTTMATLATAVPVSSAHAVVDPLCGTTITSNLTLTRDVDCTGLTGNALTIGANNVVIDGAGYKLIAPDASRAIFANGRTNIAIQNIDVSGWCGGVGVEINNGTTVLIENVIADNRSTGVYSYLTSGLTVRDLHADGNSANGLWVTQNAVGSIQPVLERLTLTNNITALRLGKVSGLSITQHSPTNPNGTLVDVSGSRTGLNFEDTATNVTVDGLTLENGDYGIFSAVTTSSGFVFRNLDVSGFGGGQIVGGGTGIYINGGNGHTLEDIVANKRGYGLYGLGATLTNLTIRRFSADAAYTSGVYLSLGSTPITPPGGANVLTLEDLRITNSRIGLTLANFVGTSANRYVIDQSRLSDVSGNQTSIYLNDGNVKFVTFTGAASPGGYWKLGGFVNSIWGNSTTNDNLRFERLDVSGLGGNSSVGGIGLNLGGSNLVIEDVIANDRQYGVFMNSAAYTNLRIDNLRAARAFSAGLYLHSTTLSPTNTLTLSNLRLTDSIVGLHMYNVRGVAPTTSAGVTTYTQVIDPSVLVDVSGNTTNIYLEDFVMNLKFKDLVLRGPTAGIYAAGANNNTLAFENLDLSGNGNVGYGLQLGGANHTLTNVRASNRATGVYAYQNPNNLKIDGLTATWCSQAGLQLAGLSASTTTPPSLKNLTLTNNASGLLIGGSLTWTLASTVNLNVANSGIGINLESASNLTLKDLVLDNPTGVQAYSATSNLTFDGVDASGKGIGLGIWLRGPGHKLINVKANRRTTGVNVDSTAAGFQVAGLTATRCQTGLFYTGPGVGGAAPTFSGLVLTDNAAGATLNGAGSYTFGPASFADALTYMDARGSSAGLNVTNASGITIRNLRFDNSAYGIYAQSGNANLTFDNVDVSGKGIGTGMRVDGVGHTLTGVKANDRWTGVEVNGGSGLRVTNLQANRCPSTGLYIAGVYSTGTPVPPVLSGLDLKDNSTGLSLRWAMTPWTLFGSGPNSIGLNAAGSMTGLEVNNTNGVITLDGFTLNNRGHGVYAQSGNSNLTFKNLNLSGDGLGTGMRVDGAGHKLENITASNRQTGLYLQSTTNPSLNGLTADQCGVAGLLIQNTVFTTPPTATTLTGLNLRNSTVGLQINTVSMGTGCTVATCPLAIGSSNVVSLAGSPTAIALASAPSVTVAHTALGLNNPSAGTFTNTLPAVVAPCGTTLTSNLTLTADLDCTGVNNTNAITVGAPNLTINGNGFKIIAPNASNAIYSAQANTTIENIDVSNTRANGTGIYLQNTTGSRLSNVTTNLRGWGVRAENSTALTIAGLTADRTVTAGLYLNKQNSAPTLSGLRLTNGAGDGLRVDGFDGWFGATSGPKFTFDASMISDLGGNETSINLTTGGGNVKNLGIAGLALNGRSFGFAALNATGLTLTGLDTSSLRGFGTGVSLNGSGHSLNGLTASRRAVGVALGATSDVTIDGLIADGNTSFGISLNGTQRPLVLNALQLTNSNFGIRMVNVDGKDPADPTNPAANLLIGPSTITSYTGTRSVLWFSGNDRNITVAGPSPAAKWKLATLGAAVEATLASENQVTLNSGLAFRNLDVSGSARSGAGLNLAGTSHTVEDVVANDRDTGLYLATTTGSTVRRLDASGCINAGLWVNSVDPASMPVLDTLKLTNSGYGLRIYTAPLTTAFVLGPTMLADLSGNQNGLMLSGVTRVTVKGLTIPAYQYGVEMFGANSEVIFDTVNVSGSMFAGGTGLQTLSGSGLQLLDVTANDRAFGVNGGALSRLTVKRLKVARASSTALYLVSGMTLTPSNPLVLEDLELTDSGTALRLDSCDATANPLTLGPSTFKALSGNDQDVWLNTANKKISVVDLTLRGRTYGFVASHSSNSGFTLQNLDVSRLGGRGIYIAGSDHVVGDIDANNRFVGVQAEMTSRLEVDDLRANGNFIGFYLTNTAPPPAVAPKLSKLRLTNSGTAFNATTLTGPLTLDSTTFPSGSLTGNLSDIQFNNVSQVKVTGLTLSGFDAGITAAITSNTNNTFENLDLSSPTPRGVGLAINGANHVVRNVTVNGRSVGINADVTTNLTLDDVRVDAAGAYGILITNSPVGAAPPVLSNLRSTNGAYGLHLTSMSTPFTVDQTAFAAGGLDNNLYGVGIVNVQNLTLAGLDLSGSIVGGIGSGVLGNANLTIRDIDASRMCSNNGSYGVQITGADHVIDNVEVSGRQYGILADGRIDRLTVKNSVIGANTHGLYLSGPSLVPDTTVVANVANTTSSLRVAAVTGMTVGMTLDVSLAGGTESRVISAVNTSTLFVTLASPLSVIPPAGTVVRGQGFGTFTRFTVENNDICANGFAINGGGTGLLATTPKVSMTDNFWRANSGPRHVPLNPGGTGDLITATGITSVTPYVYAPYDKLSPFCNREPVADAGPDQDVCEGDWVTLDGSASTDPDLEPLSYDWTQIVGQTVVLSGADSQYASFIAPAEAAGQTLSFQVLGFALTVSDDVVSRSDTVSIDVTIRNKVPTADAGEDLAVDEHATVNLAASGVDPEGTPLTYQWTQVDGPMVMLSGASTASPTFTAPDIAGGAPGSVTLTFQVTATDELPADRCGGTASDTDLVVVTVNNVNTTPVADAGDTQTVFEDDAVSLDGAGSTDPDGDALVYAWTQTGGSTVVLDDASAEAPTFTAPTQVPGGQETLTFSLVVDDTFGGVSTASAVSVIVKDRCAITGDDNDCDGLDSDCDGEIDNHYVPDTSCFLPGVCSAGNVASSCGAGGLETACQTGAASGDSEGLCNGVDDDCDGQIDEDYVSLATSCGVGACASSGATSCVLGDVVDSCVSGAPAADDTTCDGIDDDCSGQADEDYLSLATSCGVGACASTGATACVLGDVTDSCVVPTADTDGDLIPDCADLCAFDPTKVVAGQCGCGTLDLDPDLDGTASCNDGCPEDPAKLAPGTCGCGKADDDLDQDQVIGCLDNCPSDANGDQTDFDSDGAGDPCDPDDDNDGVLDTDDNCHFVSNADQTDTDKAGDGGDACDLDDDDDGIPDLDDNCHFVANPAQTNTDDDPSGDDCDDDDDNDGVLDTDDNCRTRPNPDQLDNDGDPLGDVCDRDDDNDGVEDDDDNCPLLANADQDDNDGDGDGDVCDNDDDNDNVLDTADNCPLAANADQANFLMLDARGDVCDDDDDNDGVPDLEDNCQFGANPDQRDTDLNGQGDVCDDDDDNDGVLDTEDVCPVVADPYQSDLDLDGLGDACDDDDDGDLVLDTEDGCPTIPDPQQDDFDGDGIGDACDDDRDGDGVLDIGDNCVPLANALQTDTDLDGDGDACDLDDDGDQVLDVDDGCPLVPDPAQGDHDQDGLGDLCDDDDDNDGVPDTADNCPLAANTDQADNDLDGLGDLCDVDDDNDGALDTADNCPLATNADQANNELDPLGDVCDPDDDNDGIGDGPDNCPLVANVDQSNLDGDGLGDACDSDRDGDGVLNVLDNCPETMNGDQADLDGDGFGDACDGDLDGDGLVNLLDNCPVAANADQVDLDLDGHGDACDADIDGDGVGNSADNCPRSPNPGQSDNEGDGQGDACDPDDDNDNVLDTTDNCPLAANVGQANNEGDARGDVCDLDDDNDGVPDLADNCPLAANVGQTNTDGDSQGNVCDLDDDNDGVPDLADNCPLDPNPTQPDGDEDGFGDACDGDDDDDGVGDGVDICPDTPAEVSTSFSGQTESYCRNRGGRSDGDSTLPVDPANGCSIDQLCPCAGPRGQNVEWNNHGDYVSCVTAAANSLARRGVISDNQKSESITEAAHSECGMNPCKNNRLKNQAQATAPSLVLEIPSFQRWGTATPTTRMVFAGTTQVFPDAAGRYAIPLVDAQNKVIVDPLGASGVQSSAAIPRGAFVVLRGGDGNVVAGLKGYLPAGQKVAMEVVAKVINGRKGGEKDISFEGQGNGFAVLGVATEDELWREILQVRMQTTVATKADLMSFQVCK